VLAPAASLHIGCADVSLRRNCVVAPSPICLICLGRCAPRALRFIPLAAFFSVFLNDAHRLAAQLLYGTGMRVLDVSASSFYDWLERAPSRRTLGDSALREGIRTIHTESGGTYGAPRIRAELAEQSQRVGRKRVARLTQQRAKHHFNHPNAVSRTLDRSATKPGGSAWGQRTKPITVRGAGQVHPSMPLLGVSSSRRSREASLRGGAVGLRGPFAVPRRTTSSPRRLHYPTVSIRGAGIARKFQDMDLESTTR